MFLVSYLATITFFDVRCLCAELCDVFGLFSWLVGSLVCKSCLDQVCSVHRVHLRVYISLADLAGFNRYRLGYRYPSGWGVCWQGWI